MVGHIARVPSPSRRTVLSSAAWGISTIAVSVAAPAFAASGPTTTFSSPSYVGPRCGVIAGISVVVEGTPDRAGNVVVVQVSDGYAFADGSTSATVVTGSQGVASVPDVAVPVNAAPSSIVASMSGAATASALLAPAADAFVFLAPSGSSSRVAFSGSPVPVAADLFLIGGTLRTGAGDVVQTDVDRLGQWAPDPSDGDACLVPIVLSDGTPMVYRSATGTCVPATGVPRGALPVASDLFLDGGRLHRGQDIVASDVASYGALVRTDDGRGNRADLMPYRDSQGRSCLVNSSQSTSRIAPESGAQGGPPLGSAPVACDLFLAGGTLYRVSWGGASAYGTGAVASDVGTCGLLTPNPYYEGELLMPYVDTSGHAMLFMYSGNAVRTAPGVPLNATPLGADLFVSGRTLYEADSGVTVDGISRVGQPGSGRASANTLALPYTTVGSTC